MDRTLTWILLAVAGCTPAGPVTAPTPARVVVQGDRLAIRDHRGTRPFTPWGFNYDRTALDGRDALLEDVLIRRPEKLERDFAAMRDRGGNTVRIFVALSLVLKGSGEPDADGLRHVRALLDVAERHGLWVILVGLANIRPSTAPAWMQTLDDDDMLAAQRRFWHSLAAACRDAPALLAYDLQNEPAIHARNDASWTDGCFDMPAGPPFCYVHRLYRQIESRWTRHIHERFATPEALSQHWPDYPRPGESWNAVALPAGSDDPRYAAFVALHAWLLRDWATGLREAIRSADPDHLITIGALDPLPMADAVDFYCLHLYPQAAESARDWRTQNRSKWGTQIERVPRDKPLLIEEMFPLGLAPGISCDDYLTFFLSLTRERTAGWVSFYWGEPDELPARNPFQNAFYAAWLELWARHAPDDALPRREPGVHASRPAGSPR